MHFGLSDFTLYDGWQLPSKEFKISSHVTSLGWLKAVRSGKHSLNIGVQKEQSV
jgi:hypothetical protein